MRFAWLRGDIDRWADEHPGRCVQSVRRVKQVIKEFRFYVCGKRPSLPDFSKQRAAGHRISTAHVESVMNHLVNHRLSKTTDALESRGSALSPAGSCRVAQRNFTRRLSISEPPISETFWIQLCSLRLLTPPHTFHSHYQGKLRRDGVELMSGSLHTAVCAERHRSALFVRNLANEPSR